MWTLDASKDWLSMHNIRPMKPAHATTNYYRFRINLPERNHEFYTKEIGHGILFVFQR
jgi:hypothetical protein